MSGRAALLSTAQGVSRLLGGGVVCVCVRAVHPSEEWIGEKGEEAFRTMAAGEM